MPLNFPTNPTNDQIHTFLGAKYKYNASINAWLSYSDIDTTTTTANTGDVLAYDGDSFIPTDPNTLITGSPVTGSPVVAEPWAGTVIEGKVVASDFTGGDNFGYW